MFIANTLSQLDEAVRAGAGEILVMGAAVAAITDYGGAGDVPLIDAMLMEFQRLEPPAANTSPCLLLQKVSRH